MQDGRSTNDAPQCGQQRANVPSTLFNLCSFPPSLHFKKGERKVLRFTWAAESGKKHSAAGFRELRGI